MFSAVTVSSGTVNYGQGSERQRSMTSCPMQAPEKRLKSNLSLGQHGVKYETLIQCESLNVCISDRPHWAIYSVIQE